MDQTSGLLTTNATVHVTAEPRLLAELEPAYRVFLSNLADIVFFRTVAQVPSTSPPGIFWCDVFVHSRISWWSFVESMLWHTVAAVAVWALSAGGTLPRPAQQRPSYSKSSLYYYPPSHSFSARTSSSPRAAPSRARQESAHQAAMRVAREQRRDQNTVAPPDAKLTGHARAPNLGAPNPAMPTAPLSATGRARLTLPSDWASVVAPPPDLNRVRSRRDGLSQASVVAPPPDVGGISGRRAVNGPNGHVIEPPPSAQGSMRGSGGLLGDGRARALSGGGLQVVPPPPSVQGAGSGGRGLMSSLSGAGGPVVPPPPSVQGTGNGGAGRLASLSGGGSPVPPPPSVQGTGSIGAGRLGSWAGGGSKIVPPPPSLQGAGHGAGGRGAGSLADGGSQVIPPPPSVQGAGNGRGGRLGSLGGGGSLVVPPPPSVQGAGNGGGGRLGSFGGGGSQVIPPPPSVQGAGNGGGGRGIGSVGGGGSPVIPPPPSVGGGNGNGGGRLTALAGGGPEMAPPPSGGGGLYAGSTGPLAPMDSLSTDAPMTAPPAAEIPQGPPPEDLPLQLVSLAMPTSGSSFFSNYEVFIAKRRVRKGTTELIKLVYVFLPYQKRLSEYVQSNAKVYTLRVTRDPSCDESLMQMTWSEVDQPTPGAQDSAKHDLLSAGDKNSRLPCYRTTADDYQRALVKGR